MPISGDSALRFTTIAVELIAAIALLAVPLTLTVLRRRRGLPPVEARLLRLVSVFVGLVGVAFGLDALSQLVPEQQTLGLWVRIGTPVIAVAALALIIPTVRELLAQPSRRMLEEANATLQSQIDRVERSNDVIALSEARYRLLVDTASEGIWTLDRIGRITFANPRLSDLLGRSPEQLKGMTLLDLVPEDDRPDVVDTLQQHRRGLSVRGAGRLLRSDGQTVPVQLSSSPMLDKGEVVGILGMVVDLSDQMAAQHELRTLADDLEVRVAKRTEAYRETAAQLASTLELAREQSRTYGILHEMSDMLQTCTTPQEAARVAAEFAIRLFDADSGAIYAAAHETGSFTALHQWGVTSESAETLTINECWALRQNKTYPSSLNQIGLRCGHLRLGPTRHCSCLPMFAQGQSTGLISLRRAAPFITEDNDTSAELQHVERLFASTTAQFLANLSLRRSLEQQSLRDPLTNLFNRRYFNEQLAIEFERANRARTPLSLQMVDVDHFKRINDRFGHEAGDRVLKMVADVLTQNARSGDIVCRWGGEEFLILMPGSNGATAKRRADEIRGKINQQVEIVGGMRVSVSIGVASYPEHAADPDGLIDVSDRALYASKGAGRNRVTVAVSVM